MLENSKNAPDPRRGPTPLPMHIGLAMAEYARLQSTGSVPADELQKMLFGIKKYQAHSFRRSISPLPIIWERGSVTVSLCAAEKPAASLILIPSLINKSYILDLLPERSLMRWLAGQGISTYLVDWGNPLQDEALHNIDSLIKDRLCPLIEKISLSPGGRPHALGYCMGGTILAAAAQHQLHNLRSIVLMASPWDFEAGDRFLAGEVQFASAEARRAIEQKGHLPTDWIQGVFAAVNARRALKKFAEFAEVADDSAEARLFVTVEDWLNDGVDLPGSVAETCITDWYTHNKPGKGEWEAAGKTVDLKKIDIPALVIASQNDRLVPRESTLAMAGLLPKAKALEPSSGHIGMITGRSAQEQVWQPVADWVKNPG